MKAVATIDALPGALTPGAEAVAVPVTVRNASDIVQAYDIEVLGVPARFATVTPPMLNLYPGTSGTATVTLAAPRSSEVRAGDYPMGVKVTPAGSPGESVTQETTVRVLPYLETTAELIPRTSRGRRGAVHDLAVDNRGNVPIKCIVAGEDSSKALKFDERPQILEVGPGEATFAAVSVKPVQGFWRGPARTHPFVVTVTPEDGGPVTLDGTHLQEPKIPKWFWRFLLALLGLLLLLLALWFFLLKGAIESAAEDAVADEVAAAEKAADDAATASKEAGAAKGGADKAADDAVQAADKAEELVGEPGPTQPTSERLEVSVGKGDTASDSFSLGDDETMDITDVVFENPQGDSGTLELRIAGNTALRLALENFRAVDYHFVTPLVVQGGQSVSLRVNCRKVGKPPATSSDPTRCLVSAFVGGKVTAPE